MFIPKARLIKTYATILLTGGLVKPKPIKPTGKPRHKGKHPASGPRRLKGLPSKP